MMILNTAQFDLMQRGDDTIVRLSAQERGRDVGGGMSE